MAHSVEFKSKNIKNRRCCPGMDPEGGDWRIFHIRVPPFPFPYSDTPNIPPLHSHAAPGTIVRILDCSKKKIGFLNWVSLLQNNLKII